MARKDDDGVVVVFRKKSVSFLGHVRDGRVARIDRQTDSHN